MTHENMPLLRWGIVGCGLISSRFVHDLCIDRENATARHVVKAVGSSSQRKGSEFVTKHCLFHQPAVYDSYHGVYNDKQVDIIYIGTPHVFHVQNALDAIAAGKHVLCEKPMAMNAPDVKRLETAARDKGVFLMEAVWTRFFPITRKLHTLLHERKVIGAVSTVFVEFGLRMPIDKSDPNARTASKELGAGALLDIGIYTLTWASLVLDKCPAHNLGHVPELISSMNFNSGEDLSRVDEQTTIVLRYNDLKAQAICTASLLYKSPEQFARIEGSNGSIIVGGLAASRADYLIIQVNGEAEIRLDFDVPGYGFHYEADAVAEDIHSGRMENEICSLQDSFVITSRMDAARKMCGLAYLQDA